MPQAASNLYFQKKHAIIKRSILLLRRYVFNIIIHFFTISVFRLLIPRPCIRVRQVSQEEFRRKLFRAFKHIHIIFLTGVLYYVLRLRRNELREYDI
jgi:hypothetical protein